MSAAKNLDTIRAELVATCPAESLDAKAARKDVARLFGELLSGRRQHPYTAMCLARAWKDRQGYPLTDTETDAVCIWVLEQRTNAKKPESELCRAA